MIQFYLNNSLIKTSEKAGSTLLDFIRYNQHLVGTKIGCREGDCGACTVLMGQLAEGKMNYKSLTSCITPLGNAQGKHIVTIEGLNMEHLTPFQQAMVDESGQQCGFCTVGFIVSFAGECLSDFPITYERVISAIDGNICRCTGYKSIERAADIVYQKLKNKNLDDPVNWLVEHKFIPEYFLEIPAKLKNLDVNSVHTDGLIIGGGTDLLVQIHDTIYESEVNLISDHKDLCGIDIKEEDRVVIKAATNTTDLLQDKIMNDIFPSLWKHLKLVSSTPIRNIATIAGNFINASPIGDLTAFFIALDSDVELVSISGTSRYLKLKDLYLDYKVLNKTPDEFISNFSFKIPDSGTRFNFEKVSKRRYLDIASVNSGLSIRTENNIIVDVHISAGGVGPIPMYLSNTCQYLKGKEINNTTLSEAIEITKNEISPISDARGSKEYKSLLLRQLIYAHFIELFPEKIKLKELV